MSQSDGHLLAQWTVFCNGRFFVSFSAEVKWESECAGRWAPPSDRSCLSLSKQSFKKISFPMKLSQQHLFFPPGYCLCVCYGLLSAFIYLALQSHNRLSTCTFFVCLSHLSLSKTYSCWCIEKDVLSLPHGNSLFPLLKEQGDNLAPSSLCISLSLCFLLFD